MSRLTLLIVLLLALPAGVWASEGGAAPGATQAERQINQLEKPLYNPFIERYVLDELKSLRTDLQHQRAEFSEKFARTQLEVSDRAINYTTSTVNNVFFVITAAASILALVGWTSLRDIRHKINEIVERKVTDISSGYEIKLEKIEQKLKQRTDEIISAHEEISRTNTLHSLWMRAGLEATAQARIDVYDRILRMNPGDVEALTYKADAILELNEPKWALNLCEKALTINPDYAYAHYQRACAYSTLNQLDAALNDIEQAVELSATYIEEAKTDPSLTNLRKSGKLAELFDKAC